jgi:hypothetical protein
MAHFAQIDENNIVTQVLVVSDQDAVRGQDFLANDLGLGVHGFKHLIIHKVEFIQMAVHH